MREFLAWPDHLLHRLPYCMTLTAGGAVLEPLGVAIHSLDLGHVRLGSAVAVVGCGPIGLLLTQVLRAAGACLVTAFDPLPHRRAAATRLRRGRRPWAGSRAGPGLPRPCRWRGSGRGLQDMACSGEAVQRRCRRS